MMFGYMFLGVGAMCIYYAIRGKGMAFNNHFPAQIKEESDKLLRKFFWILGPIILVQGYLDVSGISAQYGFIYGIFFGVSIAVLAVYYIIFRKKFGKILKESQPNEINKSL